MPVPRDGDTLSPTGAVVLRGRRGVVERGGMRSTWTKGCCTWCGKLITEPRRTFWCSQWCVDAFSATQPDRQRDRVQERDQGRCQICGVSTERLQRVAHRYVDARAGRRDYGRGYRSPQSYERLAALLTALGRPTDRPSAQHLIGHRVVWWDMDHTIPIVEGGHPYDLRNLRTLCWWCHKRVTAEGATRRAEHRRGAREDTGQGEMFDRGRGAC